MVAQSVAPSPPTTIPALFLSDIHLDPFSDPAKVPRLNAAPVAEWAAIFATAASHTQTQDVAALSTTCPARGVDTSNALWLSSLRAIQANAANASFVTISGDLLAHVFDCKYKTLLPAATHADYLAFVEKTIRYELAGLQKTLPGVPIYIAMGNNDSGCTDYALDPTHDDFLGLTAKIVAEGFPGDLKQADRDAALHDFTDGGNYSTELPAVPHTRLIVLEDTFLSANYVTCSRKPDPAPAAGQIAWLQTQLNSARERHERVWVMGHIPPGVDLYTTARRVPDLCSGGKPKMYLGSEALADLLAANADIVTLGIFGHTHSDEMHLLTADPPGVRAGNAFGVPLKTVASITPINGNHPTFTLARINPATATLTDYTVVMASNSLGDSTTKWNDEYTYSTAYREPAFDGASLASMIAGFQADPMAQTAASQAYLRNYFPGDASALLRLVWPQYACSMNHDSGASFAKCACAAMK